jgi:hypothetical protein
MAAEDKNRIRLARERAEGVASREPNRAFWACGKCGSPLAVVAAGDDIPTLVRSCRSCERRLRAPAVLRRWSRRLRP